MLRAFLVTVLLFTAHTHTQTNDRIEYLDEVSNSLLSKWEKKRERERERKRKREREKGKKSLSSHVFSTTSTKILQG